MLFLIEIHWNYVGEFCIMLFIMIILVGLLKMKLYLVEQTRRKVEKEKRMAQIKRENGR